MARGSGGGQIRTRKGDAYKPVVLRNYKSVLNSRVIPQLGAARLADLRRVDLQDFAGRMLADGLDPSTIRGTLMPLRSVIRRALQRDELHVDPFAGLGPYVADQLEIVEWRGHHFRVPPLSAQLATSERRGLDDCVRLIRAAMRP